MKPPGLLDGRRRWLFASLVGLSILQAFGFAGTALATRAAFGAIAQNESVGPLILSVLAGSAVTALIAQFYFRIFAEVIGQNYVKSVRLKLFEHASMTAQSALNKRRRGYQFMRFIGDLTALKQWPGLGIPRLIQALIVLPASTLVLFVLHSSYGWMALAVIAVAALAYVAGRSRLSEAHRAQRRQRAKIAADMAERMPLAPQLNAAQRQRTEANKLAKQADKLADLATKRRRVAEALKLAPELAAGLAAVGIVALGSHSNLSTGTIAGALAALALIATPLRNLMATADKAAAFEAAHERLADLLARPTANPKRTKQRLGDGPLSLELYLYSYGPIHVAKGQMYALPQDLFDRVAPYLTGKEPAPSGWIKVGEEDVSDIESSSLGQRVLLIDEHPLVLKGSLRRALSLGLKKRPSDEQVLKRIETAGLNETLAQLGGLERRLSENAVDLTPGEKIRLSILRAAVLRPGLVLVRQGVEDPAVVAALPKLDATQILIDYE